MKYYRLEAQEYTYQDVPEVGHGIWGFCTEKKRVQALQIGETAHKVKFCSGAGTSYINVSRVQDKDN